MKQNFLVLRGDSKDELLLKEFAELEKNETSLTMEKRYSIKELKKAAKSGTAEVVALLRTVDFFPPESIAEKLASGVIELLEDPEKESVKVVTDDISIMRDEEMLIDDLDEDGDIDDLLDDDISFDDAGDDDEDGDDS